MLGRGGDLYTVSLEGDRELRPLLQTPFNEQRPVLSPNGRWVAFESDLEGQDEVYVRPFPDTSTQGVRRSRQTVEMSLAGRQTATDSSSGHRKRS